MEAADFSKICSSPWFFSSLMISDLTILSSISSITKVLEGLTRCRELDFRLMSVSPPNLTSSSISPAFSSSSSLFYSSVLILLAKTWKSCSGTASEEQKSCEVRTIFLLLFALLSGAPEVPPLKLEVTILTVVFSLVIVFVKFGF